MCRYGLKKTLLMVVLIIAMTIPAFAFADNLEEASDFTVTLSDEAKEAKVENAPTVDWKIQSFENETHLGEILVNEQVVMRIRGEKGGYSIPERTKIIFQRVQDILQGELDPAQIQPEMISGDLWVVKSEDALIGTVDEESAEQNSTSLAELSFIWANNFRSALGAEPIVLETLKESAMASFYWQGKFTASDEPFDENLMTAAHRTLPFNTKVLVTDLQTGKSVIVRINDRGPHVRGREIDLSRGSARLLGNINRGVFPVKIQIIRYD